MTKKEIYIMGENRKLTTLVLTALLTAVTLLCTLLLKIPIGPECYINLGDAVIILSVMILPRGYACFVGAVGTSLADLIGGFPLWAPASFIIKILSVLVLGFMLDLVMKKTGSNSCKACNDIRCHKNSPSNTGNHSDSHSNSVESDSSTKNGSSISPHSCHSIAMIAGIPVLEILGYAFSCIIETLGHFVAETIIFGNWIAAAGCMPMKLIEIVIGVAIAIAASKSLNHTSLAPYFRYKRPTV